MNHSTSNMSSPKVSHNNNNNNNNNLNNLNNLKGHSLNMGVAPLENMKPRDWAAREIYTSELQYCQHLDTLVNVCENSWNFLKFFLILNLFHLKIILEKKKFFFKENVRIFFFKGFFIYFFLF